MSLFFSSSSFAGIENWADTSVCLWLKSSGGGNPVPLAEAKKRGISCKDGKVIKSQQKSSKIGGNIIWVKTIDFLDLFISNTNEVNLSSESQ